MKTEREISKSAATGPPAAPQEGTKTDVMDDTSRYEIPRVPGGDWVAIDEDDANWLSLEADEVITMLAEARSVFARLRAVRAREAAAGRAVDDDQLFRLLLEENWARHQAAQADA